MSCDVRSKTAAKGVYQTAAFTATCRSFATRRLPQWVFRRGVLGTTLRATHT